MFAFASFDRVWFLTWTTYGTWLPGDPRIVQVQFEETARHRGYSIVVGAVMNNHVHLVVGVTGDPDPSDLLRDFKSYASRALNRRFGKPESGTWWTEQGSKRKVNDARHFEAVIVYVSGQENPLAIWQGELEGTTGG